MATAFLTLIASLALLVLGFHAIVYSVRQHSRRDAQDDEAEQGTPSPRAARRAGAFLVECMAFTVALLSSLWRCGIRPANARPTRRPVILLHGYGMGAGSLLWIARHLRRDGWNWVWCVGHRAAYGDIRRNATMLAEAVDRLRNLARVDSIDIVAHSMGGLVARAYIQKHGGRAVHRLITLGTPHRGTVLGALWSIDPMVRQMRVGSTFLGDLAHSEHGAQEGHTTEMVSIYSMFDAIVVPARNAYHPGAVNIEIEGVGHAAMLLSGHVYQIIRENLSADDFLIGKPDV